MNKKEEDAIKDEYSTKDLYFAAFLYIKGVEIKNLEKYGVGRSPVYFIFHDKKRCLDLESVFWNGVGDDVMVNIKDYTTAIRNLRIRAFGMAMVVKQTEGSWSRREEI